MLVVKPCPSISSASAERKLGSSSTASAWGMSSLLSRDRQFYLKAPLPRGAGPHGQPAPLLGQNGPRRVEPDAARGRGTGGEVEIECRGVRSHGAGEQDAGAVSVALQADGQDSRPRHGGDGGDAELEQCLAQLEAVAV